ncbi:MAG: VOC family protein [Pseudomonadota bacterium]
MNNPVSAVTQIEHVNITVTNPLETAQLLCRLFDWEIRWQGPALSGGSTVHVGNPANADSYLALYTPEEIRAHTKNGHEYSRNLNHIGVVVPDLESTEERVLAEGLVTENHGDYEPGRRFYFYIDDNIEIEAVSYNH